MEIIEQAIDLTTEPTIHDRCLTLIKICGGQTKLANRFGIPLRTVQNWSSKVNLPKEWIVRLLEYAVDHDVKF